MSAVSDLTTRERTLTMHPEITPMSAGPWTLNGLSERLIVAVMQCHGG
jgi:hypothetical protein